MLREMIDQSWWRDGLTDAEVVASRMSRQWGSEMNLSGQHESVDEPAAVPRRAHAPSQPVDSRALSRRRLDASRPVRVSFCAISGVLAAEALHRDAKRR